MKKPVYIKGLLHHRFKFGLKKNFKVLLCRLFGHRLNDKQNHAWCPRCGLSHEEIYLKSKGFRKQKSRNSIR